jgi:hypothetical protein
MKFTVEATVWPVGTERWRLQKDGSWRLLKHDVKIDEVLDWVTNRVRDVKSYGKHDGQVTLGAKVYRSNPSTFSMAEDRVSVGATVHRFSKPNEFTIDELRDVIRQGEDSKNNSLILNLKGQFLLREFNQQLRNSPEVAVRHETFVAGAGYVGRKAAADDGYIKRVYAAMLQCWVKHLESGRVQQYADLPATRPIDRLQARVRELTSGLR